MSPITELIGGAKAYGWGKVLSSTSFESIATSYLSGGSSNSVTFSSIPQTFTHLQIRCVAKNTGIFGDSIYVRYNGDTNNTNYPRVHYNYSNGNVAQNANGTTPELGWSAPATGTYGMNFLYTANIMDILDYTSSNKNKVIRVFYGSDPNGNAQAFYPVSLTTGLSTVTSPITSITLSAGNVFAQYSHFALYGIRG